MNFKEQFGGNGEEQKEPLPHVPTPEEQEVFDTVARLIRDGGEILKYNEWTREQNYVTEIKKGGEISIFKTGMPLPSILGGGKEDGRADGSA
jgi:hypothetical protein